MVKEYGVLLKSSNNLFQNMQISITTISCLLYNRIHICHSSIKRCLYIPIFKVKEDDGDKVIMFCQSFKLAPSLPNFFVFHISSYIFAVAL